jgi:hypothetical protein
MSKKLVKIYFFVSTALLLFALAAGGYVWLTLQKLNQNTQVETPTVGQNTKEKIVPVSTQVKGDAVSDVVIDTTTLPPAQQSALKTLGLEGDTVTLTAEMITCAKEALGEKRSADVLAGSAPTPLEALKLLPCFNK